MDVFPVPHNFAHTYSLPVSFLISTVNVLTAYSSHLAPAFICFFVFFGGVGRLFFQNTSSLPNPNQSYRLFSPLFFFAFISAFLLSLLIHFLGGLYPHIPTTTPPPTLLPPPPSDTVYTYLVFTMCQN